MAQCNHWNLAAYIVKLHLASGKNVLTDHIVAEGQMNLAILDFKRLQ